MPLDSSLPDLRTALRLPIGLGVQLAVGQPDETMITEAEAARHASFGHPTRRVLFALGRTAARTLLAERLGVDPLDVPLVVADDGAPEVAGHPVEVSLSHTLTPDETPIALAAVGDVPLGVDIEALKPRRPDLYRFLLHPEEYRLLHLLTDRHSEPPEVAVVRCWAMKEAVLKALRTGFRLSPKKLRLTLPNDGDRAFAEAEGTRWRLHTADVLGCAAAVAVPASTSASS